MAAPAEASLQGAFSFLHREARELWLSGEVDRIELPVDPQHFYRDYVAVNRPVVIAGAAAHWPALDRWSNDYLRRAAGDLSVSVAMTPNGRADAVTDGVFMLPHEEKMKFGEVLDALERPPAADAKAAEDPVLYVQKQNDNLHTEFEALLKDVVEPSWATAAFESRPDAVNLWIGDDRSVSTLHKDPYDNIYCVVAGTKTFTLRPPCDLPFVGYKQRPVGTWRRDPRSGAFTAEVDRTAAPVHWCDWEPVEGRNQGELTVEVRAGDALFIPSLWFHRVAQRGDRAFARGRTIAVNFWFDMRYDSPHYVYYRFLEKLVTGE